MIAGQTTFSVKFCVGVRLTPLVAVNDRVNVPVCVGVPPRTRVAGVNVTPVGSAPRLRHRRRREAGRRHRERARRADGEGRVVRRW